MNGKDLCCRQGSCQEHSRAAEAGGAQVFGCFPLDGRLCGDGLHHPGDALEASRFEFRVDWQADSHNSSYPGYTSISTVLLLSCKLSVASAHCLALSLSNDCTMKAQRDVKVVLGESVKKYLYNLACLLEALLFVFSSCVSLRSWASPDLWAAFWGWPCLGSSRQSSHPSYLPVRPSVSRQACPASMLPPTMQSSFEDKPDFRGHP